MSASANPPRVSAIMPYPVSHPVFGALAPQQSFGTFTVSSAAICPDLLRLELIGEADGLRGRIVRWFFMLLDRVLPVR